MTWRVGRQLGRTLYRDEVLVGMVDTPEFAAEIVNAQNRLCEAEYIADGVDAERVIHNATEERLTTATALLQEAADGHAENPHWVAKWRAFLAGQPAAPEQRRVYGGEGFPDVILDEQPAAQTRCEHCGMPGGSPHHHGCATLEDDYAAPARTEDEWCAVCMQRSHLCSCPQSTELRCAADSARTEAEQAVPEVKPPTQVIDLFEALKKSLEEAELARLWLKP